jgi:hypothetical protein
LIGKPEDLILYYDLKVTGCMDAVFFGKKKKGMAGRDSSEMSRRALRYAKGEMSIDSNYVAVPIAPIGWTDVLESCEPGATDCFGNSYVGACVAERWEMRSEYLKRLAKNLDEMALAHLTEASKRYSRGADPMKQFVKVFPFVGGGTLKEKDYKKDAEISEA